MPDTRPGTKLDKNEVCGACLNYDKRKEIDWETRILDLGVLCDQYRRRDGRYDCIVPVSGGKDSHYQVHIMKEKFGMNPLLVTVGNPFTWTKAGWRNFTNIGKTFGCDHYLFNMSADMLKRAVKIGFEESGDPLRLIETAAYTVTLKMAVNFDIPLIMFGENPEYEYGTTQKEETANEYIANGLPYGIFRLVDIDYWEKRGILRSELNAFVPPTKEQLGRVKPTVEFMSRYIPWSSKQHLDIARLYGFTDLTHEWKRDGHIENYEQLDCVAYPVHFWLKYPKFGFQRASDVASRYIREGLLDLEEAIELIAEEDPKLDQRALDDFLDFTGYTAREFWEIVDKFWNKEIFEKVDGVWRLK